MQQPNNMAASTTARHIQYIGSKPRKQDNITRSGLEWGQGEILPVPAHIAAQLVNYPDVWKDVTGEIAVETATAGGALAQALKPVDDMEKAQLKERVAVLEEENYRLRKDLAALQPAPPKPVLGDTLTGGLFEDPPLVDLNSMDKDALAIFAQRELAMDLDKRKSVDTLRVQVAETIATRKLVEPDPEVNGNVGN
jgi:hypothetical protein